MYKRTLGNDPQSPNFLQSPSLKGNTIKNIEAHTFKLGKGTYNKLQILERANQIEKDRLRR